MYHRVPLEKSTIRKLLRSNNIHLDKSQLICPHCHRYSELQEIPPTELTPEQKKELKKCEKHRETWYIQFNMLNVIDIMYTGLYNNKNGKLNEINCNLAGLFIGQM